ncbi:hypothetical protein DB30_04661 [Enhygromyxa salina]|uniref:DUF2383 domain-containing protein n=1 Tax=Enhygromyxa salina TaxID=215803 RepID=A0A0C2D7U2_9BACT|nr:DUF2383 domain-containing protein [Enhygromyxa salina]KIG19196.1 hypothetical protein DB30_04661 [Enhygromyxa salina]
MNATSTKKDIDQLNEFLRGERSAVETYNQCIEKFDEPQMKDQLRALRSSHQKRVAQLESRITELGGKPDSTSGAWGSFAKLVEGGAKLLGKSPAINVIEEGEDHGKKLYDDELDSLTAGTRSFIVEHIIPEQRRTHDTLAALRRQV